MKGSGKPKFNRTSISQNTGAMKNNRSVGKFTGAPGQRNNKAELIAKMLKKSSNP